MINRLKKLTPQFRNILKISSKLAKDKQYDIYLVGGVVRDLLLGRPVVDLDIAVEGKAIALVQEIAKYFNVNFRKHHSFGTATLYYQNHKIDFATARRERYPHPGSLPKVKPASLEKDLLRRDFTINAMAISLNKKNYGQLIDFYGGQKDLKQGSIRTLYPESFLDDSLRILRAVRFEQRFGFKIETKTYTLMKQAIGAGALSCINPHRLRDELILLFSEYNPYRYIKRFYLLEKFNFISEQITLNKNDFKFIIRAQLAIKFWERNFIIKSEFKKWLIYIAAILIKLPEKDVLKIIDKFGFKKDERATIMTIKKDIKKIKKMNKKMKASDIYKNLNGYSQEALVFFYAYYSKRKLRENIKLFLSQLADQKLKIRGKDLKRIGIESSFFMGKVLKKLFWAKLDKNLKTKQQELNETKKIIKK